MRVVVDPAEAAGVDVAVDLRRRERRVAEQLLDRAQVGAALEEMCRVCVTQAVRMRDETSKHARLEPAAEVMVTEIVAPYLIEVTAQAGGWSPTRYRERIRAEGPSVGEFSDAGHPAAEGN